MTTKTNTNQTLLTAGVSLITLLMAAAPAFGQHNRATDSNYSDRHSNASYGNGRNDQSNINGASHVPTDVNNGSFAPRQGFDRNNGWNRNRTTVTNITNTTTYVSNGRNRSHEAPMNHFRDRFIPEQRFHSSFGRNHEFRVNREVIYGGHRRFRFGGVSFAMAQAWPAGWLATDSVYVDYVGGAYMLCNRRIPALRIPVNVDECESCGMAAAEPTPAPCDTCNAPEVAPTLSRGQSIAEVVSILGTPARAMNLGVKQIYLYPNMKVVFINGRMIEAI